VSSLPKWVTDKKKPAAKRGKRTFAGLFSGCGGFDLGGLLAGFAPVYAADIDPIALETYCANVGTHAVCVELGAAPVNECARGVDLLLGGPPCQGFSTAGSKEAEDPRNKLWHHYLEHVHTWEPKVFLMENVPGFLREFPLFSRKAESELGGQYRLFCRRFVTQYYGVPQFRDRVIVQGVRNDVASGPAWPKPTAPEMYNYTKSFPAAISMAEALQDLGPPDSDMIALPDHRSVPLGKVDLQIALHIPNGGSLKDIPDSRLPPPYAGRVRTHGGWTWFYRKPRAGLPARGVIASVRPNYATILAPDVYVRGEPGAWSWEPVDCKAYTDKGGYYTSPVPQRRLTLRECARLQTFPDWFRFEGTPLQVHRQIGNAVPVEFARRLCEAVARLIEHGDEVAMIPIQPDFFSS
jgi:DNA (cytosine-5)-methyltransferase 1